MFAAVSQTVAAVKAAGLSTAALLPTSRKSLLQGVKQ